MLRTCQFACRMPRREPENAQTPIFPLIISYDQMLVIQRLKLLRSNNNIINKHH